jgi:hypothetical protein
MAADLRGDLLGATTAVTPAGIARLWFGVLAGPLAWTLQLSVSYPLAQLSCHAEHRGQHPIALELIALGALVVIAFGAVTSWHALRALPSASSDGGHSADRGRFMAGLGLLLAVMFSLVVIATAIPTSILHACQ